MEPPDKTAQAGADPLREPPAEASAVDLDIEDLAELRAVVAAYCAAAGLPAERQHRLVTAADEVGGNAVRHGAPPVWARVWATGGAVVCEVTDHGEWTPDPQISHLAPPPGAGLGLWAVRLLVDEFDIRTGPAGTRVRLHLRHPDHDDSPLETTDADPPRHRPPLCAADQARARTRPVSGVAAG